MAVTNLFEIGHFPFKIVEFTTFSMKQVCKPKKEAILMLTLCRPLLRFLVHYMDQCIIFFLDPLRISLKVLKW